MNRLSEYMQAQRMTVEASQRENDVWYSEPEIRLAEALTKRGFKFEQQKRIKHQDTTAVLDFLVEDFMVVEIDGREFHHAGDDSARDHWIRDHHGYWTLRVPGWRVMRDPEAIVSLIALRISEVLHATGAWEWAAS